MFREFDDAHDTYVHTLDNTEDIDAAELYYDSVCSTYCDTDKEIRVYIDNPNRNVSDANNDQEVTSLLVQALNLPRVEIDKFDGSPKHYTKFMNIFKESVEYVTSSGHKRLTQLL